jgi:ADP-ribose pyrophosphatase YjhB (NUDIX family)
VKDGKLLLGRRDKKLLEGGKWGLLGGYINRDETVAQGVTREVMEESGWTIHKLRLIRVNDSPDRPHEDRQNIDFLFTAKAVKCVGEADWETAELKWFSFDELPKDEEIAFDHADTIHMFLSNKAANTEIIYGTI